jgi:DNA polymerase-3 subunit delta'
LLKVLEEPPERGVLFLITHAPGRLLATIRSRCRRLTFQPWAGPAVAALLERQTELDGEEAQRIAGMARGSPGAALSLATYANLELDRLARRWVDEGPVDRAEQLAIADGFRGAEGPARFEALLDRLAAAVKARSLAEGGQGAAWADLWTRLTEAPERAAAINLDRADILAGALADLARVKARVR